MALPRFTANEDFRLGRATFEAGNSYTPEKHGIDEEQLGRIWQRGWAEVEGWDKAPERKPGAERVQPEKARHGAEER